MSTGGVGGIGGGLDFSMLADATQAAGETKGASGFGELLKAKFEQLNELQNSGDQAAQDLATGRADDVAQVMMQVEQANIALELATTVRNKAIDAYQEILRMQV